MHMIGFELRASSIQCSNEIKTTVERCPDGRKLNFTMIKWVMEISFISIYPSILIHSIPMDYTPVCVFACGCVSVYIKFTDEARIQRRTLYIVHTLCAHVGIYLLYSPIVLYVHKYLKFMRQKSTFECWVRIMPVCHMCAARIIENDISIKYIIIMEYVVCWIPNVRHTWVFAIHFAVAFTI